MRREFTVGCAVTFFAWAVSMFVPQSREWWVGTASSAFLALMRALRWLWVSVAIPRVVLWTLVALLLVLVVRQLAAIMARTSQGNDEPAAALGLNEDEMRVLQLLAERDGNALSKYELQQLLQSSRLRSEHVIATLKGCDLIEWNDAYYGYGPPAGVSLTPRGRALCVNQGWSK